MVTEDKRNMVIFVVLAAILLFAWTPVVNWISPPANPPVTKVEKGKSVPLPNPTADPAANTPQALRDRALVLADTPRVAIDTPKLKGSINLKGARIDDLELKNYDETVEKNSPPVRLLSPAGAAGAYVAQFGWNASGFQAPNRDTLWTADAQTLTPGKPVTLTATNATGQRFAITIAVDNDYMFTVTQKVANTGAGPVVIQPRAAVTRAEQTKDVDQWAASVGPMVVQNRAANYLDYKEVGEAGSNGLKFDNRGGWAGFTDHYWLTAVIPNQNADVELRQIQNPDKSYQAEYALKTPVSLEPGKQSSYTSHFFAGAKEVKVLDGYEADLGISKFGYAIDWGWFGIIEQPIFYYLDWLFRLVGNFGLAIILLTFTIRLLLFPIAQRQFASMAAMRVLQPKMKALQERYKDDKPRQQQEIMKLYKEEKVNPLAGCLPILLQIPIMFALYKVLLLTIEMRHQPFVLWIKDLSAPDPMTILNLGGYLNFTPPSFLAIGVIPILLGVSMYFQIKLNPAPMDEMQKQIFSLMPWMLMFLMAPFAVGLQVYWITSNIVTIAQQWWLYQKHPVLSQKPEKPEKAAK